MDFTGLRYVNAIVNAGSVSRAAIELHCVQSNVTTRLSKLEECLEARLFVRTRQGMIPTPAGQMLHSYSERILALVEEAKQAVQLVVKGVCPLSLATMESTAAVRLPHVLARFHAKYPTIELTMRTGTTWSIIEDVLSRRIDAGLIAGPFDNPQCHTREVFVEELVLVEDRSAKRKTALLALRNGCIYRAMAEAWLRENTDFPFTVMEFDTLEGILGCVAAGMGCAIMPRVVVERPQYEGMFQIRELGGNMTRVPTLFIWRKDAPAHSARETLVNLLSAEGHFHADVKPSAERVQESLDS